MAFAGVLGDADIKAALDACSGKSTGSYICGCHVEM